MTDQERAVTAALQGMSGQFDESTYPGSDRPKPDWRESASCRGMDPDLWFPERGEDTRRAVAVCQECPVIEECLDHGLRYELDGLWGGQSQRSMRQIRVERDITASRPEAGLLGIHAACGTDGGYHRHYRAGTAACDECKAAHRAANEGQRRAQRAAS